MGSRKAEALNDRGTAYAYLQQYEQAIQDFTAAIEIDPNSSVTYSNRAVASKYLKKYDEALDDYNKAIEMRNNKNDGFLYFSRGVIQ